MPEFHAEPYLYLAGLTHNAALIAWGAFYFRVRGQGQNGDWKLVDDDDLEHVYPPRRETIGARSEPFGKTRVELFDLSGTLITTVETTTANHVWVTQLEPDTAYRYRVIVSGEEWAAGERRDWVSGPGGKGLMKSGKTYDNRFRTFPHPDISSPLTFAALGDFGVGVSKPSTSTRRQQEVALALERISIERNVRLILTTGDNIYARTFLGIPVASSGDEDDDLFFTFYQPYRYIINRIPVYPSIGNHDSGETEASDDREQMLDNFFINTRFSGEESAGNASFGPGVFYKFKFGSDIEFICLDTTRKSRFSTDRFFEHPNHQRFLNAAFPVSTENATHVPKWRIPFSHHPPFTAGPNHSNSRSMNRHLVPLFERSGVRAVFSGHEHNFQHSRSGGIDYFVTGAGAKVNRLDPSAFDAAHTVSWSGASHFVLVDVTEDQMTVTPIGELDPTGGISVLRRRNPRGDEVDTPIIIRFSS